MPLCCGLDTVGDFDRFCPPAGRLFRNPDTDVRVLFVPAPKPGGYQACWRFDKGRRMALGCGFVVQCVDQFTSQVASASGLRNRGQLRGAQRRRSQQEKKQTDQQLVPVLHAGALV